MRSAIFDGELSRFLETYPDGVIVNLGEGLETQRFRVDSESALWLSVDVPETIAVRERFIQPDARHLHLPMSALDPAWLEHVPAGRAVYVTAQGLFMYFEPRKVEALVRDLATRLPGAWLAFDHIPGWLSRKTLRGWWQTTHYRTHPCPGTSTASAWRRRFELGCRHCARSAPYPSSSRAACPESSRVP